MNQCALNASNPVPMRLKHPTLQPAVERLQAQARSSAQLRVEWEALKYWWLYTTRPDGQRMRAGDTFADSAPRGRSWSGYMGTLLTASYYGDGVLLKQFERQGGATGNETLFEAAAGAWTLRKP